MQTLAVQTLVEVLVQDWVVVLALGLGLALVQHWVVPLLLVRYGDNDNSDCVHDGDDVAGGEGDYKSSPDINGDDYDGCYDDGLSWRLCHSFTIIYEHNFVLKPLSTLTLTVLLFCRQ